MGKVLSCFWNVSINGKDLDQTRMECIESIDIEEQCDGSDTCTLTINDPDFYYIEDNIFIEEASILVVLGWHGDTHRVTFTGYISAIDINFPEDGFPVLSIYCLDSSHIMNRKKKNRSWDNVTNADVVKKIAKEYGFKCEVEAGYEFKKEDTISQSNCTDISFCESLAQSEREPFMCKLIGDTVFYKKKGLLQDPVSTLYYKKFPYDVRSFSPQINKETRQEEVTKADINTNDKSIDKATATDSTTSRDVQGEPIKTSSSPTTSSSKAATPSTKSYTYNPATGKWE